MRIAILLLTVLVFGARCRAQILTVEFGIQRPSATVLRLFSTRGNEHHLLDSALVDRKGRCTFRNKFDQPGFYQLAVSDTDRVDLILDPREERVELRFDGTPLQEHITVVSSLENQRLWEYKRASRDASRAIARLQEQLSRLDVRDSVEQRSIGIRIEQASSLRAAVLQRLISADTSGYFARVVRADQRLNASVLEGTRAIKAAVRWADPGLLRSAVYPNAIMALLQSATPATAEVLSNASDSLLAWAAPDEGCWRYMRTYLLRLFVQYGAEDVAQHLVDTYVMGPATLHPPEHELLQLVAAQLRVAVGSVASDIELSRPGSDTLLRLSDILPRFRYTTLFFYSSTCDHCHEQMPGLVDLYQDMHASGLEIIGIALDDNKVEFETTIDAYGLRFPCYTDLRAWGSPAAKAFSVKATPSLVLIDGQGRIVAKPYDHEMLRETIERLGLNASEQK